MQFLSDNAAAVHPAVWRALQAADQPDAPYDGDRWSARLDEAFAVLFGQPCAVLWVATGTAANCLALGAMVASGPLSRLISRRIEGRDPGH